MNSNIGKNKNGLNTHFFLGLEEVLGTEELSRVSILSNTNIPEDEILPVRKQMDKVYGKQSARGLAICSGRAAFKYLLEKDGRSIGFEDVDYHFLPIRLKVKKGLEMLAKWVERTYAVSVTIHSGSTDFEVEMKSQNGERTPANDVCMCDFISGLLQEFLAWVSGGKFYPVHETLCRGAGDSLCNIQVSRQPLD